MKENIETKNSYELVKESTLEYGKEINLNRHIPHIFDGIKPSYKRVILSGYDLPDKLTKTSKILADTSKYHVHGTDGLKDVVGELVRWKIFEGQGNIGYIKGLDIEFKDASARYTEAKLSSTFRKTLSGLLELVPFQINELGNKEPEYIPNPIPILAIYGGMGVNLGCKGDYPAFTKESLLEAYLSNDPYKLVFNYDYKILKGDLKDIWENSKSSFELTFPYEENDEEIIVYGNPEIFKINFKQINKLILDGQLKMINMSSEGKNKLIFKRQFGARKLSIDDMKKIVKKSISKTITFNILVQDGKSVYEYSLKQWIDVTYKNYLNLLKKSNEEKIKDLNLKIKINDNFKQIAQILIDENNKDTYEQISKKLNLEIEVIESIGRKSINSLRNPGELDNSKFKSQLNDLINFDYEDYIKKLVMEG